MDKQAAATPRMATTSLRRSRVLILAVLVVAGFCFFGFPSGLSRANIVAMVKPKPVKVEEIHGLLHFVTRPDGKQFDEGVDVTQPLDMSVYSQGEDGVKWESVVKKFNEESPVVVFSKTYCPFSQRAKTLLEKYNIEPKPIIVEVDLRDDDMRIKQLLTRLTYRGTFPNVIVRGKSIGGFDDLHALHSKELLRGKLEEAGLIVRGSV